MTTRTLETDYLVVGAGAAGMAFTDALIAASDADVVIVDRRHAPGGHWHDAYPFVRLHQPSAYYGVNSLPLGSETIDTHGSNRGWYERATAPEICAYYQRVMDRVLLPSGRVRYYPLSDWDGGRIVSHASGAVHEVRARKKIVDARYLQPSVPATTPPPFDVAPEIRCVPVGALTALAAPADGYVIIGAGKTAIDACLWLLELGVPHEDVQWIKPRENWLINREYAQGGELVGTLVEGFARQMEAAAHASSLTDLFARLNASAQVLRVDDTVEPTMYKGATMSVWETEQLRRIRNVVRLGRIHRIERDRIVLDEGAVPTNARRLHVHCAAAGLNPAPGIPLFAADRITLQPVRTGLVPFNAALAGYIEATRQDDVEKNRLCPPNPMPDVPLDWVKGTLVGIGADYLWSKTPDIAAWLEAARLNPSRGIGRYASEPAVQSARARYAANVRPAVARLQALLANPGRDSL